MCVCVCVCVCLGERHFAGVPPSDVCQCGGGVGERQIAGVDVCVGGVDDLVYVYVCMCVQM